jgi:hypothetical protein
MGRYDTDDDLETTGNTSEASEDPTEKVDRDTATRVIKRGWGNAEKTKQAGSPFAQRLQVGGDPLLVKFLEDEPYTNFRMHWIERAGQKSFTCIDGINPKGCPLCDAGSRPSTRHCFNVALLSEDGEVVIKSYEVGPRVIDSLKNFHNDPRQGPLSKHYWAISRSGKGPTSQTNHQMVRDRDMEEEWNMQPLTEEQIEKVKKDMYDESIVPIPARKTLLSLATEELDFEG